MIGKHLIAGNWVGNDETFANMPVDGNADHFAIGTAGHIDQAALAAEQAFGSFAKISRTDRAEFLRSIADEIGKQGDRITELGTRETGLPATRLEGERARTVGQIRLFADHIEKGDYLDRRHDPAMPDRQPAPRPDLRMMQRPIGPVAIFGASNFPLAFSTAGGDTASALAAGCPVIVKGHDAHPGTAEIVAGAILAAIKAHNLHPGVFSLVQGGSRDVGQALVRHPLIRAVGFTGSLAGGRALFDLCMNRPDPIPFFGELGSVNPMFLLPEAVKARGHDIAGGWAASLTMGAGQFCTNPGIAVVIEGADADAFTKAAKTALDQQAEQLMLTDGIAQVYRNGRDRIAATAGVQDLLTSTCDKRNAAPDLFATTGKTWLTNRALGEEVFGPLGLVVQVADADEMLEVAQELQGQLTATLHMNEGDLEMARGLLPVLERKAGRLLANAFPTGVEVCESMVHGGPYPASTNFGHTSVGTLAIRRFLRPVCYQGIPKALLPDDLR